MKNISMLSPKITKSGGPGSTSKEYKMRTCGADRSSRRYYECGIEKYLKDPSFIGPKMALAAGTYYNTL
jgi:hypothetical protein